MSGKFRGPNGSSPYVAVAIATVCVLLVMLIKTLLTGKRVEFLDIGQHRAGLAYQHPVVNVLPSGYDAQAQETYKDLYQKLQNEVNGPPTKYQVLYSRSPDE